MPPGVPGPARVACPPLYAIARVQQAVDLNAARCRRGPQSVCDRTGGDRHDRVLRVTGDAGTCGECDEWGVGHHPHQRTTARLKPATFAPRVCPAEGVLLDSEQRSQPSICIEKG